MFTKLIWLYYFLAIIHVTSGNSDSGGCARGQCNDGQTQEVDRAQLLVGQGNTNISTVERQGRGHDQSYKETNSGGHGHEGQVKCQENGHGTHKSVHEVSHEVQGTHIGTQAGDHV